MRRGAFLGLLFGFLAGTIAEGQTSVPEPPPMDWHERWGDYVDRTFSLKRVAAVSLESAVEQTFQIGKCGRPPYCFPHHIGGSLIRRTARTSLEFGFGALLKEDLRRKPSGLPGFRRRAWFAVKHATLAKGSNGAWHPAYSRYLGTLGAVTVASSWNGRPLTAGRLSQSFGWTVSNYFQDALLAEFEPDLLRLGRNTWRTVLAWGQRNRRTD